VLALLAASLLLQSQARSFGESYAGDRPRPTFTPRELARPPVDYPRGRSGRPTIHVDSQLPPAHYPRGQSNPSDPFPVSPFYEAAVLGNDGWVVWWREGVRNAVALAEGAGRAARPGPARRVRIPGRSK
jgi:hypothetical protein